MQRLNPAIIPLKCCDNQIVLIVIFALQPDTTFLTNGLNVLMTTKEISYYYY